MRETRMITIDKGRDAGKVFVVTEMPASKLEKWAARALLAIFAGDVPVDIRNIAGVSNGAALAAGALNHLAALDWEKVEPLYDELLTCVVSVPDPACPSVTVPLKPGNLDAHIQDVATLLRLRSEVLAVNFDFFGGETGLFSRLKQAAAPTISEITLHSPPA